ncbi:hypothetical protein C1903_12955 [Listeria ivanovii]|nr:DUF5502 family protein [Listeria ivanovii]PZF89981.1 hypothetical protein C1905_04665 [Listeria ivanovii]PZF92347.1 hypothetical protein C1903_12955 [Listeria ivanovii]PZG03474.1 hypothetical protein C2L88_12825 [Listeria ivanovii]PZG07713.1 hypothetical protein C1901_12940 [Listeria ivanovii]PZG27498.1 hypothetical protein C1900_04670 [Listeria ivanovii]
MCIRGKWAFFLVIITVLMFLLINMVVWGDDYVKKSNKVKMQKIECGMDCKGKASSSKIMVFPAKRFLVERTDSIEAIINKHEKNDFETTVLILILDKKDFNISRKYLLEK